MNSTITIIILTALLASCGRSEILDKAYFEVFADNPFNNDVEPLSAYHGEHKSQIIEAKHLAEEMGVKFQPIYVRNGQGNGEDGGFCADGGPLGKRVVLYPDSWPNIGEKPYYLVSLLLHEYGHCGRNLSHDNHGIMKHGGQDYSAQAQLRYLIDFNVEHRVGLDIGPFLKFVKEKDPGIGLDSDLAIRLAPHIRHLMVETDLTVERHVQNPERPKQIIYGSDVCETGGLPIQTSTCPRSNAVLDDFLGDGFIEVECPARELTYDEARYEVGESVVLDIRATVTCSKWAF